MRELQQADDQDEAQLAKLRANIASWQGQITEIRTELYDYPADLKLLAGVVLHLDHSGDLTATRGLIRQGDREAVTAQLRQTAASGNEAAAVDLPPVKTRPVHSEALTNRLLAQRVMAVQAEIIQRPNLALCLLIEQMLVEVGDAIERAYSVRSFDLSATNAQHDLKRTDPAMEDAPAWKAVQAAVALQTRDVPAKRDAVLPWLLSRPQTDNIELLAALLSMMVFRVRYNGPAETKHLDRLGQLVGLDMAGWWSPTVGSYLGHVSKDRIAAVVTEAVGEEDAKPLLAMKKGQAAEAAAKLLEGRGWVPEMMRSVIPTDMPADEASGDEE